jgi:hypothetical protein
VQSQVAAVRPLWLHVPFVATVHAQSVSATGTVRLIGGGSNALTGTYDSATRALALSGSGFTFTGSAAGPVLTGTYTAAGATGTFSTRSTATTPVTVYCGNIFSSGNSNEVTGVFNLVVSGSSVNGAFSIVGSGGYLTGAATGTSLAITYTNTTQNFTGTATATISGSSVSGRSDSNNPFSGSTGACPS